jgi:hypothetical protein
MRGRGREVSAHRYGAPVSTPQPSWRDCFSVPQTLVLYSTPEGWRYASYSASGVMDGRLSDIPADGPPQAAQEALHRRMEEAVQQVLTVVWSSGEKPG